MMIPSRVCSLRTSPRLWRWHSRANGEWSSLSTNPLVLVSFRRTSRSRSREGTSTLTGRSSIGCSHAAMATASFHVLTACFGGSLQHISSVCVRTTSAVITLSRRRLIACNPSRTARSIAMMFVHCGSELHRILK
ncbi:uncharacterized protein A1O9_05593 [Exophiala aquamarina CBS 119918]|uniref:Uncharacterized protein n=1 Tax=Exophiala aquamarina CBS 119918 TaxID=1182545 RepID=A0A072PQ89_9EURO|nr:uncharacterized protein A1O9_05593 [Exophiala aquamarina CBS 119918]KEF57675.1 hypothetical protein A1O9_05593 [Exophiala aquamarina CBS 119918]